ncbi:MAG TPA: hypothetical protein VGN86_10090 [Pyrinomonadaceae bacterium]|nr:hypothetical protein [Pyrinomonadaceae bacterium]
MSRSLEPDHEMVVRPDATKRDLMIATWEALDCESVGKSELGEIQLVLENRFGKGGNTSPAAIGRVLADEGAVLRHPELLEADVHWRRKQLRNGSDESLKFDSLDEAVESFARLHAQRREILENDSEEEVDSLYELAARHKADCLLRAASPIMTVRQQAEAKEVASWFDVWLRTPELFEDWLELRRASAPFRKRFGG